MVSESVVKAWLETPLSFFVTDVLASIPNLFLYRVVRSDNTVSIQPTSPYSRVITALLAIGYGIASYLLADYSVRATSEDAKYLSLGASSALLLDAIADAIVVALMGQSIPTTHPATKLIK